MTGHWKNLNSRSTEDKENAKQDQSTEASKRVNELRRRKYHTRAAKKLVEEICGRKQSCIREEDEAKKHREDILKSKHSSDMEAKIYKQTFPSFKRKMVEAYGETFYYNGGSWHGEESRRYRHYHIRKSMRFLNENMNNDSDDEWKEHVAFVISFFERRQLKMFCVIHVLGIKSKLNSCGYNYENTLAVNCAGMWRHMHGNETLGNL